MSTRPIPCYEFVCDFPGCENTAQEGGEFSGWGDEDAARDDAVNRDWHMGPGMLGYCEDHPTVWASDLEKPFRGTVPEFPFVLLVEDDEPARLVIDLADLERALA